MQNLETFKWSWPHHVNLLFNSYIFSDFGTHFIHQATFGAKVALQNIIMKKKIKKAVLSPLLLNSLVIMFKKCL